MLSTAQIERWLAEDIGVHDVTNAVPGETTGELVAKESGVAAGVSEAVSVFEHLDLSVDALAESGDDVAAGDVVLRVSGSARSVLRGERVAVNVLGHASGIASKTRRAVDAVEAVAPGVRVAATRKTAPGLRGLEKRAVAAGGGDTHRLDLSHMVLIKENHIAEMGLERAVERFRAAASFATKIEVEVEDVEAGPRAVEAGADVVMFDNMPPAETSRGVEMLPEGVLTEASGGITLENVSAYAETGVDVVSMGALTHSADVLDYSFRT